MEDKTILLDEKNLQLMAWIRRTRFLPWLDKIRKGQKWKILKEKDAKLAEQAARIKEQETALKQYYKLNESEGDVPATSAVVTETETAGRNSGAEGRAKSPNLPGT